jgi:aubergine-like protein
MRMRLINEQKELLGPVKIFDGMILYLGRKLDQPKTEFVGQSRDGQPIQVTIEFTNEVQPQTQSYMQILNVMMKRCLYALGMQLIGKNYFLVSKKVIEPQYGYEIYPGYTTAIHPFDGGVQLIADVNHKILRPNSVLNIMYEMHGRTRQNFYELCTKKLVGEIVLTEYNNKTYRIDDIQWDMTPLNTFKLRDGTETTFVDYYLKHHDKKLTDMKQPLLVSKPKKREQLQGATDLHLLPELCRLTGLSDEARADFTVMKNLSTYTRVSPQSRMEKLMEFLTDLKKNEEVKKSMDGMGLRFADGLTKIQGRQLGCEKLMQGDEKQFSYQMKDADWSRDMRGHRLKSCPPLDVWCVFFTRQNEAQASDLVETLRRVSGAMGMRMGDANMVRLPDGYTQTFTNALRQNVTDRTQLVVCVLPSNKKDLYDSIKKFCCCEKPVPSQCIVTRTLSKKQMLMSVCTKVAVQMNCKLGGEVWAVDIPLKGLMVIGIDSYHDSAQKGRSVGAFVASTNNTLTKYYSRVCFQSTGQEFVSGLKLCMRGALQHYSEVNRCLPERIFIYRDGVGDGQVDFVFKHEVPQVMDCFKEVGKDFQPKCAFIIVTKRINNRFFEPQRDGPGNPAPGTVIDTAVTRPEWYDFFLISQSVRQGTVGPTHYNVVHDSSGLQPNHLQRLTYKLCHLYYNWPGTIRVPAPCQYAHKLAFLVGQSLHRDPGAQLSDKLFFL